MWGSEGSCDEVKVIVFIENKTTIHYPSHVDDLLMCNENLQQTAEEPKIYYDRKNNNEEMIEKRWQ
jgi:hypothetical protein